MMNQSINQAIHERNTAAKPLTEKKNFTSTLNRKTERQIEGQDAGGQKAHTQKRQRKK